MTDKNDPENIANIRKQVLTKIENLKLLIKTNEPLPHGEQDYDILSDIDEHLETCLNAWYY